MPLSNTGAPPASVRHNARPYLHGPETTAMVRAVEAGQYGHGPQADLFERELADYLDVDDVVAVSSATVGIHLALQACGVGPGTEVIVPSQTFAATIQPIVALGAAPRFIDHAPDTLCIEPAAVQEAITPATRAVLPVLYGGRPVDLTAIAPGLRRRNIHIIEDAAQAFGSRRTKGPATTVYSFGPIKQLTALVGGAIVPRTSEEAEALRQMRSLGITSSQADRIRTTTYTVQGPGLRGVMPDVNAAVGRVQLARFDEVATRRITLWNAYAQALHGAPGITLVDVGGDTVPFNCVVRVPGRDRIHQIMRDRGIGVGVHYPPNHLQPAFARWTRPLPVTERTAREILSLPFHPAMTPDDARWTATALLETLTKRSP
ncbi:DegT/DnrJ/EryC1/StrS family aminotransferase [Streptomyces sp. TG1A-8]|uniref:DegT/DnrJ/EryC1/StrS family aminotransferase n=1 Tax=Streptomyces sp. TG1A-8 TaxID=3051385 RepID=UPI00265C6A62|nr:DegT/DnrJ/EryC1/StrS family aminotransferase [Streptomyces sp. TG1A-8]MDO0930046.1 DegT/DnrJ/EryC1/StrS family aminotransferase [Streptomyces sp. TG1A-8]